MQIPADSVQPVAIKPAYASGSWRETAARIVEELFPVTDSSHWDLLIDLRRELLNGTNWERTLDLFLACRCRLETDHYLPFYRLRRLISVSLRFEAPTIELVGALEDVLRRNHRSLEDLKKSIRRDIFELASDPTESLHVDFTLVEEAGSCVHLLYEPR